MPIAAVLFAPALASGDTRPFTIPALREWHATGGQCRIAAHPRVKRSVNRAQGREGYTLYVRRRSTVVAARTAAGRFYGTQTLRQLRSRTFACGHGLDRPLYRERGLMLDVGRRFYSRAWLIARIKQLAALKLNLLHLHLSDDQGFRVESDSHPEIVSPEHLTKDDVRALLAVARRYHVTLVPEIDMPGHMTAALAKHPELQLTDATGARQPDKLDVTLPAARKFVGEVLDEQLALWKTPWWHLGADEYLGPFSTAADYERYPQLAAFAQAKYGPGADGHDAVQDFVNEQGARIAAAGRRMRVWGDGMSGGAKVSLPTSAAVEWWENRVSPTPPDLSASGYDVLNVGWWPLYYVNGGPLTGLRSTEQDFYEQWDPTHFEGPYTSRWAGDAAVAPPDALLKADDPHLLGATLAVWNDDPANAGGAPDALPAAIAPRLRILAQKAWGSPELASSYTEFQTKSSKAVQARRAFAP
jgi:hexosaminidase